jgi:hypothetical protein
MDQKKPELVFLSKDFSPQGLIAMFEKLTGRKATPEEVAELLAEFGNESL